MNDQRLAEVGDSRPSSRARRTASARLCTPSVEDAELLVAAVPVFRGSYPGMFKHFFDLVDQYALANKPVLLAATAGGERHTLVLEHIMRPLFAFFQALTVPVALFAAAGDFDGTTLLNPRVFGRIETGLADVAALLRARAAHPDVVSAGLDSPRRATMPTDIHPRERGT